MIDRDSDQSVGIMSEVLWDMYAKIHEKVDEELMRLNEEELRIMKIIYQDQLVYPIHEHIDQLLEGPPGNETLH